MLRLSALLALAALTGCGDKGAGPHSASAPEATAAAPVFTRPESKNESKTADEPAPSASPASEEAEATPTAVASAAPPAAEAVDVDVENVGMHIGGERNTEEQKRPIREAVRAHYGTLRGCYAGSDRPRDATFGVDMRIDKEGGHARITNPRSGFGRAATECMVKAMEAVEFDKPVTGAQMVSYSLRFRRK